MTASYEANGKFVNEENTEGRESRLAIRKIVESSDDWAQFKRLVKEYGFKGALELCTDDSWFTTLRTILTAKGDDDDRVFHDTLRKLIDDPKAQESLLEGPSDRAAVAIETECHGLRQVHGQLEYDSTPDVWGDARPLGVNHSLTVFDGSEVMRLQGAGISYASKTVLIRERKCPNCGSISHIRVEHASIECVCGDTLEVDESAPVRVKLTQDGGFVYETIVDNRWMKDVPTLNESGTDTIIKSMPQKVLNIHFEAIQGSESLEATMARAGVHRIWWSPSHRVLEGQLVGGLLQVVMDWGYSAHDDEQKKLAPMLESGDLIKYGAKLQVGQKKLKALTDRIWVVRNAVWTYTNACRIAGNMSDSWVMERDWRNGQWCPNRQLPVYHLSEPIDLPLGANGEIVPAILFSPIPGRDQVKQAKERVASSKAFFALKRMAARKGSI